MPVVPSYRLQVGAGSTPNARLSSPQGRSVAGEQMQEYGQALQKVGGGVGDIALDIQKGVNDLRVQDAINQMTSRTLDLTHGEGGYTRLRQSDVMEMPDGQPLATTYVQRWDEGAAQVESKLSNDAQRQAFRAWAGQQRGQFSKELVTYEARSLAAYEQRVMKDALERDQQVRAVSWEQPEKLPELFEQSENLYVRFAQTQNLPIGVIKGGLGSYRSSIRSQAVMQAIGGGNLELAQVYLNNFKPDMTPEELDAQLQQRPDLGVSTPEQVAGVRRSVQVMQKRKMEEEEEEEEASLAQSIEHVQQALGDWTKIPVEVKERLSLENVKRVTAYSDSFIKPVVVSDAQVCSQLDSPEFLLQMKDVDFELLRGQLSPDDFEYFGQQRMAYQEAARSGRGLKDSPKLLNMAAVNKQLGSVLQWMGGEKKAGQVGQVSQASGVGQMGQVGSPSEPLAAQRAQAQQSFHTAKGAVVKKEFRNEVLSQQMALGRMLSEDELRKTWGEFLGNKVLNSFTVGGGGQRNVLTMQLGDMSAGALLAATESLVDAGVEKPTPAQIFSLVFQNPQELEQRGRVLTSLMNSSLADMAGRSVAVGRGEALINSSLDKAAGLNRPRIEDGVLTADASGGFILPDGDGGFVWQDLDGNIIHEDGVGNVTGRNLPGEKVIPDGKGGFYYQDPKGGYARINANGEIVVMVDEYGTPYQYEAIDVSAVKTYTAPNFQQRVPGDEELLIMINSNGIAGHAGFVIGAGKDAVLYDPAGSYSGCIKRHCSQGGHNRSNSVDTFSYGLFSWDDYLAYQLTDGPNISVYKFTVPKAQASSIRNAIKRGAAAIFGCATSVSDILMESGGIFADLPSPLLLRRPETLGKSLHEIISSSTESK